MSFEKQVGMPTFPGQVSDKDQHINQNTHFEKHFASQIALRRLCAELHHDINDCKLCHCLSIDKYTDTIQPYEIL